MVSNFIEDDGFGVLGNRLRELEMAMYAVAPGVDDTFGNTLVVEVEDLATHDVVFQQRGPA
jgi:hypothetical protein